MIMRIIKICFSLLIALGLYMPEADAQSSLEVYDVFVTSAQGINIPPTQQPSDTVNFSLLFKIKNPQTNITVHIQIGKQQGTSEYVNQVLSIVNHSGTFYLNLGGTDINKFWSGSTSYPFFLSSINRRDAKWVTIYLQDNTGTQSAMKYFQIQ
jgi:hypothetical protein